MTRALGPEEARTVYDRIGSFQDRQAFYEDAAVETMVEHAAFERARSVVEFGAGTGRWARRLLEERLPDEATYLGLDASPVMVELARGRLEPFGDRARVRLSDGAPRVDAPAEAFDRFVSTYVLDLLSDADARAVLGEARRVLEPGGRLALVGLTWGTTRPSRAVSRVWAWVHRVRPRWVGGCRPRVLADLVDPADWDVGFRRVVVRFGVPSEILIAIPRA